MSNQSVEWWQFGEDPNPYIDGESRNAWQREFVSKAAANVKPDDIINHDGDTWRVVSLGRVREDGKVMAHLASMTRGVSQRNGFYPIQINDWIEAAA
jgi:hypothetical protein